MKTINLLIKGSNIICYIENNQNINYVMYKDIKNIVERLYSNYNKINITQKNITISNSNLEINIENYKDNKNLMIEPIIEKLEKDYRKLKIKELKKQKIKRVSLLTSSIILSGTIIINAFANGKTVNKKHEETREKTSISTLTQRETKTDNIVDKNFKKENTVVETKTKKEDTIINDNINNFEICFESRVESDKFKTTKAYYNQIITEISNEYGIDPRIMLAIATHECGIHNPNLRGPAIGLMQIERSVWNGQNISAYNYKKGINETLNITEEKLKDLEFNIRTSCMIFRDCLNKSNYNLAVAIQMYNYGYGNINKVFRYSYGNNIHFENMCGNCDNNWLENREIIKEGDNKYLEHILSYIENLEEIQIKNGEKTINFNFKNKVKTLWYKIIWTFL